MSRTSLSLVALIAVLLSVTALALGGVVLFVAHEALEEQLDRRVAAETRALVAEYASGGSSALAASLKARAPLAADDLVYLLVDASGRKLAGDLPGPAPAVGWLELLPLTGPGDKSRGFAQALTTTLPDGARLVVGAPRKAVDQSDATIAGLVAFAIGGMLVIGVGGAWGLQAIIRRRLDRINATALAIIDGDLDRRVPETHRDDEFDRLAVTLNRMLGRNAELLENLRQVSNDIAHDLRTPLARQLQGLDRALAGPARLAAYRQAMETAADDGREMLALFSALLRISEIETFDLRASFAPVDLAEVVERVAEAFRPDLEDGARVLTVTSTGQGAVDGDSRLVSQLLVNLLENALRHTPDGTAVSVDLARTEDRMVLTVADSGPGIAPADRERVLGRFVRLEGSRTQPGHGLGLNIVAAIARAHFATFDLGDNAPGLKVRVSFPVGSRTIQSGKVSAASATTSAAVSSDIAV